MNRTRPPTTARWLPLLAALSLSATALAITAIIALTEPHNGIPASEPPLGNLIGVAQSYLFRNALKNTLVVSLSVAASVFAIARMALPRLHQTNWQRQWLFALALTPLFLPIPLAAFIWRSLFEQPLVISQPNLALACLALAQVWRLWPLTLLAAPFAYRIGPNRSAVIVMLAALWIALIDVGTPLLATGGQPFNETHLWATWAFHTHWVSRLWGYGSVMTGGLAAAAGAIGILIWLTLHRTTRSTSRRPQLYASAGGAAILAAGAFSALLPIVLILPRLFDAPIGSLLTGLAQTGYWRWVLNTLLLFALAILVATLIIAPVRAGDAEKRPRLITVPFFVGMAVVPVWYWIAARWAMAGNSATGLLLTALVAGASAGLIALWPESVAIGYQSQEKSRTRLVTPALTIVAALIIGNQFALEVIMAGNRAWHTVGTGAALRLAGSANAASLLDIGSLSTFVLVFAVVYTFTRHFSHPESRARSDDALQPP